VLTVESLNLRCTVTVTVTFVRERSFSDPECVRFFNVLFNKIMKVLKYIRMKENFYDKDRVSGFTAGLARADVRTVVF
jgi:hypothetical protein